MSGEPSSGGGAVAPALVLTNLTKTFAGRAALTAIDLTIEAGQVRAVVGENGSGKSTLVKVLSGFHRPDAGAEVRIGGQLIQHAVTEATSSDAPRRAGARFVHQDLALVDNLSVIDNLCFGTGFPTAFATIRRRSLRARVVDDLARVGLDVDPKRLVGDLLPAQKTGVALARALRPDPSTAISLLVLDEPTATLPQREVASLLTMVRSVARQHIGVLYISHHLDEVFDVADAVTVLRDGRVVASAPTAELSRARLVRHLLGSELDDTLRHVPPPPDSGAAVVLSARALSAGAVDALDIDVAEGEVLGVAGITGSGREAVCPLIFGGMHRRSGEVRVRGRRVAARPTAAIREGVAYLPADRKRGGLFLDLTAQDNLTIGDLRPYWSAVGLRPRKMKRDARHLFEAYDIRPPHAVDAPVRTLSGGNQQKVMFAKWLRRSPKVLLLDEPTQGVDLGARAAVHRQILEAADGGAAVIVSSADVEELAALCHRVLIFRDGRVAETLRGSQLSPPALSRAIIGSTDDG